MWPPIPASYLFCRTTMAIAFQRIRLLIRRSMARSPGYETSSSGRMVLTYGVFRWMGSSAPDRNHHGHRVPTDQALDPPLHGAVAGIRNFLVGPDGVDVWRVQVDGQFRAAGPGALRQPLDQICRAVRAGFVQDLIQRFHPLRSLLRIRVDNPLVAFQVH